MDFEKFELKEDLVPLFFKGVFSEYELRYKLEKDSKKRKLEYEKKYNKKNVRNEKIQEIKNILKLCITNLWIVNDIYKELYHKTEYWENKSTYDFDFKNWNTVKKVNGKLTNYLKELIEVERSLK